MSNQIYSNIYELEILAKAAYKYNRDLPDGWVMVDSVSNKQTGFYGKVFLSVKNSEVVISFSGTDLFPPNKDRSLGEKFDDFNSGRYDFSNDINMAIRKNKYQSLEPQEGDKVICMRNEWETLSTSYSPLTNGTTGFLKNIRKSSLKLPY